MEGYDPNDDDPDHGLTYDEWKGSGYYVRKGQKSHYRNPIGECLFTPNQVIPAGVWQGRPSQSRHQEERERIPRPPRDGVIRSFDDFVGRASLLPEIGRGITFNLSPLEHHFMNVADKHGVIDAICEGQEDDY